MRLSPETVVLRYVTEMWGQHRLDLVDQLVDPEYCADGMIVGRDYVRRNITRMHTAFPDFAIEIHHLLADGDRVAVLFTQGGTHLGPFAGLQPTGRTVRFREAGFLTVHNGMVTAADWVSDGLGARIQLGVLPEDFWTNSRL